ncbi:hypothetical protein [Deinococcus hohokamensis]|uniref:Uncharacterized protein n=1 Tax=Deinococcus hohokamensis TaxID=309883 RepID=A0ABV9IA59_9DEIO
MTDHKRSKTGDHQGDMIPDTDRGLSDQEVSDYGAGAGRGARPVPGAEPSDEYVDSHVQRGSDGGTASDLLDPDEGPKDNLK